MVLGSSVVSALEKYNQDHGTYPDVLEQLLPDYMSEIPKSTMGFRGRPLIYRRGDEHSYKLAFQLPAWMLCSYDSSRKEWYVND
jgi:hypothetical protein